MTMPTDTLGYQGLDPEYIRAQRAIQTMAQAQTQLNQHAMNTWDAIRHLAAAAEIFAKSADQRMNDYVRQANERMAVIEANTAHIQVCLTKLIKVLEAQAKNPPVILQVPAPPPELPKPYREPLRPAPEKKEPEPPKSPFPMQRLMDSLIDLGIGVRAYNLIEHQVGEHASEEQILALDPRAKNFGRVSFSEIVRALKKAGVSSKDIQSSPFWNNAPREFRNKWLVAELEGAAK
jgi:hypothetical protein